jgi:hypothetical protein
VRIFLISFLTMTMSMTMLYLTKKKFYVSFDSQKIELNIRRLIWISLSLLNILFFSFSFFWVDNDGCITCRWENFPEHLAIRGDSSCSRVGFERYGCKTIYVNYNPIILYWLRVGFASHVKKLLVIMSRVEFKLCWNIDIRRYTSIIT